jgi:hypothetical protein
MCWWRSAGSSLGSPNEIVISNSLPRGGASPGYRAPRYSLYYYVTERKTRVWEIAFTELVQQISIPGVTARVGVVTLFGMHPTFFPAQRKILLMFCSWRVGTLVFSVGA